MATIAGTTVQKARTVPFGTVPMPAVGEGTDVRFLDRPALRAMGLRRQDVDRIFRKLPIVNLGGRKSYVRREDLDQLLEDATYRPGERVR